MFCALEFLLSSFIISLIFVEHSVATTKCHYFLNNPYIFLTCLLILTFLHSSMHKRRHPRPQTQAHTPQTHPPTHTDTHTTTHTHTHTHIYILYIYNIYIYIYTYDLMGNLWIYYFKSQLYYIFIIIFPQ